MADGRLASVGRDRTMKIWTGEGKPVSSTPVETDLLTKVTASFDSKIAVAGDYQGRVLLWDGKQVAPVSVH
jgi:WD40 repeat protein